MHVQHYLRQAPFRKHGTFHSKELSAMIPQQKCIYVPITCQLLLSNFDQELDLSIYRISHYRSPWRSGQFHNTVNVDQW